MNDARRGDAGELLALVSDGPQFISGLRRKLGWPCRRMDKVIVLLHNAGLIATDLNRIALAEDLQRIPRDELFDRLIDSFSPPTGVA